MFTASKHRHLSAWVLVLCVALFGLLLPPGHAETPDEAAQRSAVEGFLRAFGRRDKVGAFHWMTSDSELNESLWSYLTNQLHAEKGITLELSRFRIQESDDVTASGRIVIGWPNPSSRQSRLIVTTLDLRFLRELGTWKLRVFRFAEFHLFEQFLATATEAERKQLLRQDADIFGDWLSLDLRMSAHNLADEGKMAEAERRVDLAFEAAAPLNSDFDLAYCYLARGYVQMKQQQWNPALAAFEQARALFEKIGDKEGLGKIWRNSGFVYSSAGSSSKSTEAYEKALKYFRETQDTVNEAGTLLDLGVAQQYGGNPGDALVSYQAALELQRKLGNRKSQGILIGNIASAHQDLQRYGEALRGYEEARKVFKEIHDFSGEGPILTNLGLIYQILGRHAEAEEALRAAVLRAREQKNEENELIALHNLTLFLIERNQLDEAGDTGFASVKLADKLKNDLFMPQIWSNLGEIGMRLEAWKQARDCYEEMLLAARANRHRGMEAMAIMSLGLVDFRERSSPNYHVAAAKRYLAAAEIASGAGRLAVLQLIRGHQGDLYRGMGDFAQAAVHLRQALEIVEQVRAQTEVASLQTSYLRQYAGYYLKLAECHVLTGEVEKAFAVSEQFKARSLVDTIRSGKVRITRSMTPEQRDQEAGLERRLASLSATIEKTVLTDALEQLTEERDRTRTQLESFRERLYLQHPDLKTRRADFTPAAPAELLEKLLGPSPRSALISYLVLDSETLLFVLRRDKQGKAGMVMRRASITRGKLRALVEEHWQACSVPDGKYEGSARELFRHLISPAALDLAGKAHLILVPDFEMGNLAFSALLDPQDRPLAAKYALSYAPSATALLRMAEMDQRRETPRSRVPLLAFGNPVFPTRMPELPASAAEVAAISRLFGRGAVTRTGERALESDAHLLLGRARFVHFATHGTLDQSAPMYSSIVLTRDDKHDGFLQARELAEMDLSADLVVMSACETALGQKVRGEGIIGLTWALLAAGASSTMASQWQVADESTRDLMTAFYRSLTDRKGPVSRAEALRQAQNALIQDQRYAHPYHWAPFVLLGQWKNAN